MTEATSNDSETDRLQMAAIWHARLEGSAAEEPDWEGFTVWLEADPRNRRAFDAVDAAASETVEFLTLNRELAFGAMTPPSATRRVSSRVFLAMAGLAAAVLIAVVARPDFFAPQRSETYATAAGEQRDVMLADGTTLHLNTDTQVAVVLNGRARTVELRKGEALFEVAHDAGHPFDVTAGDRRIHVVGTVFNVLRHAGRITVAVERGSVDVAAEGTRGSVRLGTGDQYAAHEGAAAYDVAKIDPAIASAWRTRRAVFTNATLSEVASDLSRYYMKPIVVADPDIGGMRFSGILKIDDQLSTVRRLEGLLPVVVIENANEVRLERGTSTK